MKRIVFLSFVVAPGIAFAAPWDGLMPAPTDASYLFLAHLFGDLVCLISQNSACGSQHSLLTQMLVGVIAFFLVLGGGFVGLSIFVSTVRTASAGELLGEIPTSEKTFTVLRTLWGFLLVMPIPGFMGLVGGHVLVVLIALLSISVANTAKDIAIDYVSQGHFVGAPLFYINPKMHHNIAETILKAEVCMQTLGKQIRATGSQQVMRVSTKELSMDVKRPHAVFDAKTNMPTSALFDMHEKIRKNFAKNGIVKYHQIIWGAKAFVGVDCGSIIFPSTYSEHPQQNGWLSKPPTTEKIMERESLGLFANQIFNLNAHFTYDLVLAVRDIATRIVYLEDKGKDSIEAVSKAYLKVLNKFDARLNKELNAVYALYRDDLFRDFNDHAQRDSWVFLGFWYWRIAKIQGTIDRVLENDISIFTVDVEKNFSGMLAVPIQQNLSRARRMRDLVYAGSGMAAEAVKIKNEENILQYIGLDLQDRLLPYLNQTGTHPLMQLSYYGDALITSAMAITVSSGVISNLPFTRSTMAVLGPIISAVVTTMFVLGFLLAFYVVAIPAMFTILSVLGWLAQLIQAMIAVPITGIMHLLPGGTGMAGLATFGYVQFLAAAVRPLLIVFGIMMSFVVFFIGLSMLNLGIKLMFTFFGLASLASVLASIILYTTGVLQVARFSFSLIYNIPLTVQQYFGQVAGWVAPGAEQTQNQIASIFGFVGNSVGNMTSRSGQQHKPKDQNTENTVENLPSVERLGVDDSSDQSSEDNHGRAEADGQSPAGISDEGLPEVGDGNLENEAHSHDTIADYEDGSQSEQESHQTSGDFNQESKEKTQDSSEHGEKEPVTLFDSPEDAHYNDRFNALDDKSKERIMHMHAILRDDDLLKQDIDRFDSAHDGSSLK